MFDDHNKIEESIAMDDYITLIEGTAQTNLRVIEKPLIREEIRVGDMIHAGHVEKGGSGFRGVVTRIAGDKVFFRSPEKGIFGYRTFVALLKNVSKVDLNERELTKAELKKREEVAKAIERDQPSMDMGKKMAIATSVAKKMSEELDAQGRTIAKTPAQKSLAKFTPPHDKVSRADVLAARGVLKKNKSGKFVVHKEQFDRVICNDFISECVEDFHQYQIEIKQLSEGAKFRVNVTDTSTGDVSHHVMSLVDLEGMQPVMSIRTMGIPRVCAEEHQTVLTSFLQREQADEMKEEIEQIDEVKVGDKVSFNHALSSAPGRSVKKTGTVHQIDGDNVHVKVKDKYGVITHKKKTSELTKEEVELDETASGFKNLPGKATHLTNKDLLHPEHGPISGSTTLRHLGGNNYEVRAGRAKGKIISLDKQHVQKMYEEVEQIDETSYERDLDPNKKIVVKGVKGMRSTPFTKKFRNMAAAEKWMDSDSAGDYTIHQVMNESIELDEEQLDELKSSTLKSYADKRMASFGRFIMPGSKEHKQWKMAGKAYDQAAAKRMVPSRAREEVELDEGMISFSDFNDKIAMHRKMGNKIIDDKYTSTKATYTSVDQEGYGRKMIFTPSGQKMENLGQLHDVDDEKASKVEKQKQGRGRPAGSKSGGKYK